MAKITKRTWRTAGGDSRTGWRVDFIDQNGERRRRQFRTKREADAFLVEARAQASNGAYVHAPGSSTVATAMAEWLKHLKLRLGVDLEKKTLVDYQGKIRLHVLSPIYGIGHLKLNALTHGAAEDFRLKMIAAGQSPANASKVLGVLRAFATWAVDRRELASNPLIGRRAKRGSRKRRLPTVPNHDAVRRVVAAAEVLDFDFALYLRFAALTGLRASEQRGLRWPNVNLGAGVVTITERLDCYGETGLPKSEAGHRTVPLGPGLLADMKALWLRHGRPDHGYVFRSRRGGPVCHDNLVKRRFLPACKAAGVRFRWHDLRAYAISAWLQAGVSIKEAQRRAGHADHNVTLAIYAVAMPDEAAGAELAAIEGRLS